jgi:nucleotidyltransferase/DNA polymerase involved in DNA repair
MSHVNDLQVEDLPGVEPHLIDKLKRAGIKSVLDLAVSVPQELAAVGGGGVYYGSAITADPETISEAVLRAKKVLIDSGALIKEFSTADQVLERRKSLVRFTTGSKNLDDFLKGGIESQSYYGTSIISIKEGPVSNIPIVIKLSSDGNMGIMPDPIKNNSHFGNTPIQGKTNSLKLL